MTANKKIPALRFEEFEGEWEEKSLGEMCSHFKSGNSITAKDIQEHDTYPVYGGNGLRGFTNSYTHDGFYVLIGRQGALCGNINRAIGKVFISEHAIAVQANQFSDTEWLAQKLELMNLNQYSESSAQPGLAVNKLVKIKIISPALHEQQKIASFLTSVDDKIQQLTKKKALLEAYKKGLMQQLFSQQLRFKDDEGNDYPDWEEKEFGNLADLRKEKYDNTKSTTSYKCVELEHLDQGTGRLLGYVNSLEQKSIKNVFKKGDVLFGKLRPYLRKYWHAKFDGVCSSEIWVLIPKTKQTLADYIFHYIQTNEFTDATNISSGSKMPRADWSLVSKTKVFVPSVLEEQQEIANILTSIDTKISLMAQQIEKTSSFKKGLLQQLFI